MGKLIKPVQANQTLGSSLPHKNVQVEPSILSKYTQITGINKMSSTEKKASVLCSFCRVGKSPLYHWSNKGKPKICHINGSFVSNANISVEVDNFDAAYGKIEYIISNVGYVQESKINKTKHYVDNKEVLVTSGVIIIRVDSDKFSSVLKDIKGLGLLTDENIKTDDVTEKFFDIDSRLRLIRYEESRLEEYLKKIQDPDTIFKTEKRLTEIRHEIEQLTGTLNKLSNLVKLSTITINMNEKAPDSKIEPVEPTYVSKLKDNFLDSLSGVIEFLGNLLIIVVAALPVLVLLGLMLLIVYFVSKKFLKLKVKKPEKKSDTADNE